jgi:hypothetical protein
MGTKNEELNADFKSIEKVAKRLDLKNLEGRELTHTVLKDEKYHNYYTVKRLAIISDFPVPSPAGQNQTV